MKTENEFFIEVEKALDWEAGYLNWDNEVVADFNDAAIFDSDEDAQSAASLFNVKYGHGGRIFARVR